MNQDQDRPRGRRTTGLLGIWGMAVWVAALALSACGGGGAEPAGGGQGAPTTLVELTSDGDDPVGAGRSYRYTQADARIVVNAASNRLSISVIGDDEWSGELELPSRLTAWSPGTHTDLRRWPVHDSAAGGLAWTLGGRGCGASTGTLTVLSATYAFNALTSVELRFEQRCDGRAGILRGHVRWLAQDSTRPAGPRDAPADLWRAAPADVPAAGNYLLLDSQPGDSVGGGRVYRYTPADALLRVQGELAAVSMRITGNESWSGEFVAMDGQSKLTPGLYGRLGRYPFHNPSRGGLLWGGSGRECLRAEGWVVVDQVSYAGDTLTAIELRFEQRCTGAVGALRGQLRWRADGNTGPAGPTWPPPAGLWRASADGQPATGNLLQLESDPGDPVGNGRSYAYTNRNARLVPRLSGNGLSIEVTGLEFWRGVFVPMQGLASLQPGFYGELRHFTDYNPARGGLEWVKDARCAAATGWFAVDRIEVHNGELQALDLRFEQRCVGFSGALRGQLRWSADDRTGPPGPALPPPADLWQPPPGSVPAGGNYVYFESATGDPVGQGATHLHTSANSLFAVSEIDRTAWISVRGTRDWNASFTAMQSIAQLEPGYYGDARRTLGLGPLLDVRGTGWCRDTRGWFVVDRLSRREGALELIEIRFEQWCDDASGPLRGKLRWAQADAGPPPGPVNPPPADLWQPAAGSTPASGNYLFLQGAAGDFKGSATQQLYSHANALLNVRRVFDGLMVEVQGDQTWDGRFAPMLGQEGVPPGYYAGLTGYPTHNPALGGFYWYRRNAGCTRPDGWVAVDEISMTGTELQAITLRFKQQCEGSPAPLYGKLRWSAADVVPPPGPQVPPPADLWRPAEGTTPVSGSFVYLESGADDPIGLGERWLYTPGRSTVAFGTRAGGLSVNVAGDWFGQFEAMVPQAQLARGYYGVLQGYPGHNPAKGGMSWSRWGRACRDLSGWFVIDDITYVEGRVSAVDLRFEQTCESSLAPLRGQIRWSAGSSVILKDRGRPLALPGAPAPR